MWLCDKPGKKRLNFSSSLYLASGDLFPKVKGMENELTEIQVMISENNHQTKVSKQRQVGAMRWTEGAPGWPDLLPVCPLLFFTARLIPSSHCKETAHLMQMVPCVNSTVSRTRRAEFDPGSDEY